MSAAPAWVPWVGVDDATGAVGFFLLGVVGSVHCLGMCGPLVTTYADRLDRGGPPTWRELRQQGLFNLGRAGTYAVVGAALGLLGSGVYAVAGVASLGTVVRGVVGIVVALLVAAVGASYLTRTSGLDLARLVPGDGRLGGRLVATITDHVDRLVDGPGVLALGALHALLPCPLLYPAYLAAFATGSPWLGGLYLAALGVGTAPTLFALGVAVGTVSPTWRARLHRVLGVVFLLLALLPLRMGLRSLGVSVP